MQRSGRLETALLVGLVAVGLTGCGEAKKNDDKKAADVTKDSGKKDGESGPLRTIRIDGSSTVAPVAEAAADEFQKEHKNVRVPVITSGTTGGFKKFAKGDLDVANASRPILRAELDEAKKNNVAFIELPTCFDAITVVVHKDNDWASDMTVAELQKMWSKASQGKVTKWSDVRDGWPDEPFALFAPGKDSGTFDYFTEAINGKAGDSRTDYLASEDDNRLVRGVTGNKYALGYFGFAYYAAYKDKLKAVKIKAAGSDEAVEPGSAGIRSGRYVPLSRPLFIYVNKASAERREVAQFVNFFLDNAAALAGRKKYVPLPAEAYAIIKKRFEDRTTGSAFGGEPAVGLSMDGLLKREPK